MRVVDANVLLYAVNEDAEHHRASRRWVDTALGGADTVGLCAMVLAAFLRLSTRVDVFTRPLSVAQALDVVETWTSAPGARLLEAGAGHWRTLGDLLRPVGTGGNLVNDAHLAALAVENRSTIVTYDNDFGRFTGIRWHRPEDLLA